MNKALERLIVPKTVLIALGAALWGFAAIRILILGETVIGKSSLNYLIGIIGFVPFFWFVFRKVSNRYASRILALPRHQSHIFAFLDHRGYIMMAFMISLGIGLKHISVIPEIYKGTFFISLGLSLLASSIVYIVRGVQYMRTR